MPALDANRNASRQGTKRATRQRRQPYILPPVTVQPGPFRQSERTQVARYTRTAPYRRALAQTRRESIANRTSPRVAGPPTPSAAVLRRNLSQAILRRGGRVPTAILSVGGPQRPPSLRDLAVELHRLAVPADQALIEAAEVDRIRAAQAATTAQRVAPALTVLEQTTRPIHGVAAGVQAAIHGQNVLHAVGQGVALKDKTLFSDVLRGVGAPKWLQGVGGFALDVGLDPTTYLTGGTGSVLRHAAEKEGQRALSRALAQGLSESQAKAFGQRAFTQALRRGGRDSRGLTISAAGRELPGVRRATAAVGRGVGRATDVRGLGAIKAASRHLAADVNPAIVPEGITRAEYATIRQATRTARSSISRNVYKARQEALAVQHAIGKDHYGNVLDAIEAGTVKQLPVELQKAARFLQSRFRYIRRVEKQAGIRGATRANYVPHVRADLLAEGKGMGVASVGRRIIRPSSSRARTDQRALAELRQAEPGKYVEDPGILYASRMQEGAKSIGQANLNRRLADMGRPVKPGEIQLQASEAIYHVRGSDIQKLDKEQLRRFADGKAPANGRYVALNEQAVDRALKTIVPAGERSTSGRLIDRGQGFWKLAATQVNPGFHVRNFVGDLQNAYLANGAHHVARNMGQSFQALRLLGRREQALKTLGGAPTPSNILGHALDPHLRGVKLSGGETVSYDALLNEAEHTGAVRSGFVSRELHDLLTDKRKLSSGTRMAAIRRWANNREDLIRLATYIGGRKNGLGPEEAAARVAQYHFDYSDLTELERKVLRRVMPFYTFSARNIPLQFKALVTRPGKYAQYEKIREEVAKAFGYQPGYEAGLPEREQRSVPAPIEWGGQKFTLSFGPGGLPLTDLNEFPTTANPVKQADEWINRGMSLVTPIIKTPIELWANMSFFFRDQIERDTGPLVPAPKWVSTIPTKYRKQLGIVPDYLDKQTGQRVWAWPAKVGYAVSVLPGPANFLNRVLTSSERAGQSTRAKTLGYAGVRAVPFDPRSTRIQNLYDARTQIEKKMAAWNQRGVTVANATPEYTRLSETDKQINALITQLRTQRGDKIVPGARTTRPAGLGPDSAAALQGLQQTSRARLSPDAAAALAGLKR